MPDEIKFPRVLVTEHSRILQVQKEAWNKSSHGWKKWDPMMMDFLRPVGDAMIRMLQLNGNENVLDVATGTGEPGLSIAALIPKGRVVATDLSEEMLAVASENAGKRAVKNFQTVCCDSAMLPFEDDSFDAITCRCSFMFFPDMTLALEEMIRVLKPGGKVIAAVWNVPEKNSWISVSMEIMIRELQLKPPAPGSPGLFRCAEEGMMAGLFRGTGLINIQEEEITGMLPCVTAENYWNFISDVASPLAYSNAEPAMQDKIKKEIILKMLQTFEDGNVFPESGARLISGEKPR